jgi:hypothetical protein
MLSSCFNNASLYRHETRVVPRLYRETENFFAARKVNICATLSQLISVARPPKIGSSAGQGSRIFLSC